MIEQAIYTYLNSKTTITNLVAGIFPVVAPQTATRPYLLYNLISNNHGHTLSGSAGWSQARIQLDAYSTRLSDCVSIIEAVRNELQGYSGTMGTLACLFSLLADEDVSATSLDDGSDTQVYRKRVDYLVKYREIIPSF